jgi:SAM-dependent methyltransferase
MIPNVRRTWDGFADKLEAEWNRDWNQRKTLHKVVTKILRELEAKYNGTFGLRIKVLDGGCGTGQDYTLFSGTDYTGVDITQEMLDKFNDKHPTAHVEIGDIHCLRFGDNEFDIVFSHDVLLHIPNWEQALQELWRVTKTVLILKLSYVWDSPTTTDVSPIGFIERKFNLKDVLNTVKKLNPAPQGGLAIAVEESEITSPDMVPEQIFVIRKRESQ